MLIHSKYNIVNVSFNSTYCTIHMRTKYLTNLPIRCQNGTLHSYYFCHLHSPEFTHHNPSKSQEKTKREKKIVDKSSQDYSIQHFNSLIFFENQVLFTPSCWRCQDLGKGPMSVLKELGTVIHTIPLEVL